MKIALLITLTLFVAQAGAQDASTTPAVTEPTTSVETSAPAVTTEPVSSTTPTTVDETPTPEPTTQEGKKMVEQRLMTTYGISSDELANLRAQKLGYGQIRHILEMSKASGKSVDDITAMLKEKKSLQQVARELNIPRERMNERKELRKEKRREDRKAELREERREERREDRRQERREERRENRRAEKRAR